MNPPPSMDSRRPGLVPPETPVTQSAFLSSKIRELRARILSVGTFCGSFKLLTISGVCLAAAMGCDWWFELPYGARLVLLFLHLTVFLGGLFLFIIRLFLHRPDEDDLALRIEGAYPEMAGRFIAALQLTRPSLRRSEDSASLIRATVGEAEQAAIRVRPQEIVSTRELKRMAALSVLLLLPLVLAFILQPGISSILLHRVALKNIPVPRKTIAIALTGNKTIGRGDDLMIEAEAKGIVPAQGRLMIHYPSRGMEYPLERIPGTGRFQRKLENVQESFSYKLRINDGLTATYSVQVLTRPVVTSLDCVQEFPAYTRLSPLKRPAGDLSLLAGSRLHLKLVASQPVKKGWVRLIGLNTNLNLQFNPAVTNGLSVTFAVPSRGLNGFSLHLLDERGMETLDPVIYPLEIIPDKPPNVVLTAPERKEELVTRNTRLSVGLQISDDYAIAKARLCFKVVGENQSVEKVELDLGKASLQTLRRRHEWKISTAAPKISEGTLFEYWIEAMDNNDVTGPGVGQSEHQFARVVSDGEKRADLLSRAGDYLGTIGEVTLDQEKANKNLGEVILEKTSSRSNEN